jgi:hypothetical protein
MKDFEDAVNEWHNHQRIVDNLDSQDESELEEDEVEDDEDDEVDDEEYTFEEVLGSQDSYSDIDFEDYDDFQDSYEQFVRIRNLMYYPSNSRVYKQAQCRDIRLQTKQAHRREVKHIRSFTLELILEIECDCDEGVS